MTGVDLPIRSTGAPNRPSRGVHLRLPATRAGLTWLVALIVIGGLLAIQVGRQVYANYSITQRAAELRQEITDIEAQNQQLREQLGYLQSDAYVSAEARRLANVGHPGDQVLIIPPGAQAKAPPALTARAAAPKPLLEQWLDLFFGS